jgi:general secretion pathway protein M
METFIQWWRSLANRERQMVVGAVAILSLILGYLVAFEPAWVGRQKLAQELPQLRSQLAQMDALSSEARRISGVTGNNESAANLRQALEASIASAGLKPFMTQGNFQGDLIEVKFNAAPFALLATWLAGAVRETRVRVVDANVQRETSAGLVTAKIAFELPKRESR